MEDVNLKIQKLITLYNISADQNRLYAEFRWKVFYYIAILNGGLFILYFNNQYESHFFRYLITGVAIIFTLILYQFEKRHHELFDLSRRVGANIEKLFEIDIDFGVFSQEISNKKEKKEKKRKRPGHSTLLKMTIYVVMLLWLIVNIFDLLKTV